MADASEPVRNPLYDKYEKIIDDFIDDPNYVKKLRDLALSYRELVGKHKFESDTYVLTELVQRIDWSKTEQELQDAARNRRDSNRIW